MESDYVKWFENLDHQSQRALHSFVDSLGSCGNLQVKSLAQYLGSIRADVSICKTEMPSESNTENKPDQTSKNQLARLRDFVAGAKWWEYHKTGGTMWQSDQRIAEEAALRHITFYKDCLSTDA